MPKSKRERILITGATGFVGANLTHRLVAHGQDVHIFVRKGSDTWRIRDILSSLTVHRVDLADARAVSRAMAKAKPTHVYHFAAHGLFLKQQEAEAMVRSNIQGTVNLLEAARNVSGLKMIVSAGSSTEYGSVEGRIRETTALSPLNAYAVSKASQSLFALYMAKFYKLPLIVIRPSLTYGPYEESRRLVPAALLAHLRRESLQLSSPDSRKDFIYIEDVLDAFEIAAHSPQHAGEIFNIASGKEHTVQAVVRKVQSFFPHRVSLIWNALPGRPWDTARAQISVQKSKKLLGWKAQHTLEEGLKKTARWFENNIHLYP